MPPLAVVPELEEELDRLYGLPLEEFTAARNDLVKRLRKAGQAEQADEVKARARPTVSAWAINRLARDHPKEVSALLRAGEGLRRAQAGALAGAGTEEMRSATRAEQAALRALTAAARGILGGKGGTAALDRIAATLRAAAVDDDGRRLLERGRLERDLEPTGFTLLAGMPTAPRPKTAEPKRDVAAERQRLRDLRRRASDLRKEAAQAEREAQKAERTAAEARGRANEATRAAEAAEAAVAEAEAER
jgi:hypothetical protein